MWTVASANRKSGTGSFKAAALLLTLNLVLILNVPAAAVESLNVSPAKGMVGDRVYTAGSGYSPGKMVYIYFSGEKAKKGDSIDELKKWKWIKTVFAGSKGLETEGRLSTSFKIPVKLEHGREDQEVKGGRYYIYATYESRGRIIAGNEFTIIGLRDVYPTRGTSGTMVRVEGSGYSAGEKINVYYDGEEIPIYSGDKETNNNGDFRLLIIIPPGDEGEHNVMVEVDGIEDEAEFEVVSGQ